MQEDSLKYDSLAERPLPRWLLDQKEGVTTYQPREIIVKEDHSLAVSFAGTGLIVLLIVALLTVYVLKIQKKKSG